MVEEIPTKSGEKEAASATLRMPHEIFMRNAQSGPSVERLQGKP